jgi:hypothetical protein
VSAIAFGRKSLRLVGLKAASRGLEQGTCFGTPEGVPLQKYENVDSTRDGVLLQEYENVDGTREGVLLQKYENVDGTHQGVLLQRHTQVLTCVTARIPSHIQPQQTQTRRLSGARTHHGLPRRSA